MKNREKSLDSIHAKYQPIIDKKGSALVEAQKEFDDVVAIRTDLERRVNEYFDAIQAKEASEAVLLIGEPTI